MWTPPEAGFTPPRGKHVTTAMLSARKRVRLAELWESHGHGMTRVQLVGVAFLLAFTATYPLPSAAIIACGVVNHSPTFSPANPSTSDTIKVYTLIFLGIGHTTPPGYSYMSRVTRAGETQFLIDVVFTAHPENFPHYGVVPLPYDSPVASLGKLPPGSYRVVSALRYGEPYGFSLLCEHHVATTGLVVQDAAGPTVKRLVVEYYNHTLDHYFITQDAGEIADLDSGAHAGWVRTGHSFLAYSPGESDGRGKWTRRWYGRPSAGLDTHFFSASATESNQFVDADYRWSWVAESSNAFEIALPDAVSGACEPGTVPVYRLWNRRSDSNHRYTTSAATKQAMIGQGWVPEGYGPNAVVMCAPTD